MQRIVGYVDSADDTAVQGWIANLDRPEQQELIVCTGADGASAFKPFTPRLDVCQALSLPGRFGFAIPTRLLRRLGPVVTVADCNGVALTKGAAIELPQAADPPRSGERPWIVMHIQKTAGTSMRLALTPGFLPGEVALVYPDPCIGLSPAELGALPDAQRAALRLIMGHFYFGIDEHLPVRGDYVTAVREPEARLRSHYYHHAAAGSCFTIGPIPVGLARVVQHGLIDEFDNLMTRLISGHSWQQTPIGEIGERQVELALRNIRRRFRFVLLSARAKEQFPALCATMNVPRAAMLTENVRLIEDVSPLDALVDWGEVMDRNRFDVMLYERIQAEGLCGRELRPRSRAAAGAMHVAA